MPSTLALTTPLASRRPQPAEPLAIRVAVYGAADEPPLVEELRDDDPVALIEAACDLVTARSPIPAPAIREVVENLVHAGFSDAVVSVLEAGHVVRVSDHGPGIADPALALQPGFTAARSAARAVVRGVGGGLPLTAALLAAAGGEVEIAGNISGGAVVTLAVPGEGAPHPEPVPSETARVILALLLEIGSATPERLADELGCPRAECGREVALLEHRGLLRRDASGARSLTDAGSALVATLF
ncbi:ATP-binding protein [Miltoncostaea marina]|uniref:ATP-binding protein n=1 Tax=Miltoncostaea marina TaxID=2843215 RepID=UPI001C3DA8E4|nr:ATP-binding protein [Miltoncostaea marina]